MRERPWSTVAADRPADGIDSREVPPGKCLVDDDDTFGFGPVVAADRAAPAKGEAKALEITGRHDSVFGGRVLDLRAFVDTQARPVPAAAQRQVLRRADGGHAGKLTQRPLELVERLLSARPIERGVEHHVDDRDAVHPHAWLDRVHVGDTASEQRRTRGDHHRERHLRDDQSTFQPPAPSLDSTHPGCAQDAAQVSSIQRDDGHEDDERRRDQGDGQCRDEDAPIGRCPGPRTERERVRDDGEADPRQGGAQGPRDDGHDQYLDDQLLRQSLPVRTKRRTNRKLGRPRVDLPEHQGGNVGAPDQEDQCGGGKRREQRRLHGPEQVVAHRRDPSVIRLVPPRGVVETLVEHRGQLREWRLHRPNVLIGAPRDR